MSKSLDIMQSKPGLYVVLTRTSSAIIDVDSDGRCYQCTLDDAHRRDGELPPGRWMTLAITDIIGPFARVSGPSAVVAQAPSRGGDGGDDDGFGGSPHGQRS